MTTAIQENDNERALSTAQQAQIRAAVRDEIARLRASQVVQSGSTRALWRAFKALESSSKAALKVLNPK